MLDKPEQIGYTWRVAKQFNVRLVASLPMESITLVCCAGD